MAEFPTPDTSPTPDSEGSFSLLAPLSKDKFSEGSIGRTMFEDLPALEGRERPARIFDQQVDKLKGFYQQGPPNKQSIDHKIFSDEETQALSQIGIGTLNDLLNLNEGDLGALSTGTKNRVLAKTRSYLAQDIMIGPEGLLFSHVFDSTQLPISLAAENARRVILANIMKPMSDEQRQALSLRFGLEDGIPRKYDEITRETGPSAKVINSRTSAAERVLKAPKYQRELKPFRTFLRDSAPNKLGLNCLYDLATEFHRVDFEGSTVASLLKSETIKKHDIQRDLPLLDFFTTYKPFVPDEVTQEAVSRLTPLRGVN